jgi:hypothetical protein
MGLAVVVGPGPVLVWARGQGLPRVTETAAAAGAQGMRLLSPSHLGHAMTSCLHRPPSYARTHTHKRTNTKHFIHSLTPWVQIAAPCTCTHTL